MLAKTQSHALGTGGRDIT